MKAKLSLLIFVMSVIFIGYIHLSFAYDPTPLPPANTCPANLNICQTDVQVYDSENKQLIERVTNLTAERDYYKGLYEQTELTNFTVKQLNEVKQEITNLNLYYNQTINEFNDFNTEINNIKNTQIVIVFVFAIFIVFEIGLYLFKKIGLINDVNVEISSEIYQLRQEMTQLTQIIHKHDDEEHKKKNL